jgi:HSP90 family molecular chaperone
MLTGRLRLAKQIYGSGARFVFELLQNADDNSFKKAADADSDPFITFKVHPNHIIVECNEDGFSERDLDAISAVGQSTKSSSNGYIGAKGIGFKSVFIAAWRVYIQSGNFSFEFKHRKSDPGLGMVRPIWVNSDEQLAGPLTRMTLTLHDEGDEDDLEHLRAIIHDQFDELQQTCLLFLRKLRCISIEFYDEDGTLERSKTFRKESVDDYRVSVKTRHFEDDKETTESQIYHITSRKVTGLTRSDNRDAPETHTLRTLLSSAVIVLAFPLTSDFKPMITGKQELFAFLPIRDSDYKVIVHSLDMYHLSH